MGTMIQDDDGYRFKGLPLTASVVEYVVLSQLVGRQIKRSEIVDYVERFHASNGGFPCQAADLSRAVKKALDNLKARGGAENPSTGWWRISSAPGVDESSQSSGEGGVLGENVNEETQSLQPLLTLGDGDESIYIYYYPAYNEAALSSGSNKWLCKIGRTDSSARLRISG